MKYSMGVVGLGVMGSNLVRGPHSKQCRRGALVVAWCGMRGTVTLAAALALPARFPYRDLLLFSSFLVVLGTLVIQGLTVKPLMARLGLELRLADKKSRDGI